MLYIVAALVIFAIPAWLYGPALLVHWKLQDLTSDPGRLAALQSSPVPWERVPTSGERVSAGFATFDLSDSAAYSADAAGGLLCLRSPSTTILLLRPFSTDSTPATASTEFSLRRAELRERCRPLGELMQLSSGDLRWYYVVASTKAINRMNQNGAAIMETLSGTVIFALGELGSPEKIHFVLYSKIDSRAMGGYVVGETAELARQTASQLVCSFQFEDAVDDELAKAQMLNAVRAWSGAAKK